MTRLFSAALLAVSLTASAAAATPYWVDHGVTLNARSGPGTSYHVVGTLHSCSKVHVVGYKHGWAKISTKHGYYWVSAKYLQNQACQTYYKPKKKTYGHGNNY